MLLSEMFGVERGKWFKVLGFNCSLFRIIYDDCKREELQIKYPKKILFEPVTINMLYAVIRVAPAGIIHLPPPLTDEQRVVLMSLFTMGARYMGMTPDGWKRCFVNKPKKEANTWIFGEIADMQMLSIAPKMANCLDTLINLSDPEPFDIGKALGVTK